LVYAEDFEIIYKINVREDFHRRDARKRENLQKSAEMINHEDLQELELMEEHQVCEKVYVASKVSTIHAMYIVEQDIGLEHLETIVLLKKNILTLHMRHSEEENLIEKSYKFPVKSIHMINSNNFVIHEDETNNIRLLSL